MKKKKIIIRKRKRKKSQLCEVKPGMTVVMKLCIMMIRCTLMRKK
jgi:hypothetical protein